MANTKRGQPEYAIPSEYQVIDDDAFDRYSFMNARDHQLVRKNHNILSARGVRQNILTYGIAGSVSAETLRPVVGTARSAYQLTGARFTPPPGAKTVVVNLYGSCGGTVTTLSATLHGVVDHIGLLGTVSSSASVSVAQTDPTGKFTFNVPVPRQNRVSEPLILRLLVSCEVDSTNKTGFSGAATVVTDSGLDYVDIAYGSGLTYGGQYIYLTDGSGDAQTPRRCIKHVDDGASYERLFVDRPWDSIPLSDGTIDAEVRNMSSLSVISISAYTKAVTDFHGRPGS